MKTKTVCACGDDALFICKDCGRAICQWHAVATPRWSQTMQKISLAEVCAPQCKASWWWIDPKPQERRPREF